MFRKTKAMRTVGLLGVAGFLFALLLVGCGGVSSPTISQDQNEYSDLWNPGPNERVGEMEIPRLLPGYWENVCGPRVNPAAVSARAVIDSKGGVVTLGLHRLIVPAGAVSRPVTFTLSYASLVAVAVDCEPSPMSFSVPVRLIMSVRGTQYDAQDDISGLQIWYLAPDGTFEVKPSRTDNDTREVSAELDHFSRYIIG